MSARPWREPLPVSKIEAARLLQSGIPFNAVKLAMLADLACPVVRTEGSKIFGIPFFHPGEAFRYDLSGELA